MVARRLSSRARWPWLVATLLWCGCKTERPAPAPVKERSTASAAKGSTTRVARLTFDPQGAIIRRTVALDHRLRELPPLDTRRVEALVAALRDRLEFGPPEQVQALWRLLREAYEALAAEAEPELKQATELVIHAAGIVRFVPFHALLRGAVDAPGKASFVVSRWPVSYFPLELALHHRQPPRRATVFLPSYGPERRPVAQGPSEARDATLGGRAPTIVSGRHATAQAMRLALRAPGSLVHFAGHGLPNLEGDGAPELIFGPDDALGAKAIEGLEVKSSLVVLASCTTAYAARFRGPRALLVRRPLSEALLRAGAGAVVAASWGVKDAQSRAQLEIFYRQLEADGPALALARAQRDRIARLRPPHPRYWAFYALYGAARFEGDGPR